MRQPRTAQKEGFVKSESGRYHRTVKPSGSTKPPAKPYTSDRDKHWTGRSKD